MGLSGRRFFKKSDKSDKIEGGQVADIKIGYILQGKNSGNLYIGLLIFENNQHNFSQLDICFSGKKSQIFNVKFKRKFSTFFVLKNIPNLHCDLAIFHV